MNPPAGIYLDHNATTPLLPAAAEAMARVVRDGSANPASQHAPGRRAHKQIEDARERIAEILGLDLAARRPDRLIFTSGGTEANNWVFYGLGRGDREAGRPAPRRHLLVSAVEHPSVLGPAERLRQAGTDVEMMAVDRQGRVDVADFTGRLNPSTELVSVMLGNNETGVLQPVAELAAACRARGVLFHTDAVQAVGKVDVNFRALGVDGLTVAAHKFHGPLGIGALAVRSDVELRPLLVGGFQQSGLRPGTESPALVAGMHAALEAWQAEGAARTARLRALRDDLERRLRTAEPMLTVIGGDAERLPQTACIAFAGVDRQALLLALDHAGVACSTGSACASGSSEPSPTLIAMGCSAAEIGGALRFSIGASTTAAETAEAADRILRAYKELRDRSERRKNGPSGRP